MQAEFDGMTLEVKRKESSLEMANTEKERILNRLKAEEGQLRQNISKLG